MGADKPVTIEVTSKTSTGTKNTEMLNYSVGQYQVGTLCLKKFPNFFNALKTDKGY